MGGQLSTGRECDCTCRCYQLRSIDGILAIWLGSDVTIVEAPMIRRSREHLCQAGETYWHHFRFATTFGLLAAAAGIAALLHAFIPAVCTSTASRIVRHLGQLIEDRTKIDALENEAVEAKAFVLLLMLAAAVVTPLWLLNVPNGIRILYTMLAFALPAALMITNPELMTREETAA